MQGKIYSMHDVQMSSASEGCVRVHASDVILRVAAAWIECRNSNFRRRIWKLTLERFQTHLNACEAFGDATNINGCGRDAPREELVAIEKQQQGKALRSAKGKKSYTH
jgi:hypothetical protein